MDAVPENSILLHTCCGPCASACVERLREEGRNPTLFFSNANIAPREEYEKRLATARQLAEAVGVELVEDAGASHDEWLETVARGYEDAPEGGERCRRCFAFSLSRAAAYAAEHGYPAFTTSLTVSPHKRSATVFEAGREAACPDSRALSRVPFAHPAPLRMPRTAGVPSGRARAQEMRALGSVTSWTSAAWE